MLAGCKTVNSFNKEGFVYKDEDVWMFPEWKRKLEN